MPVTVDDLTGPEAPRVLASLRDTHPVAWVDAAQAWLVTRYDLAVTVMRDPETFTVDDSRFSTATVVGASMLSLDGVDHRRHRAPFVSPFQPSKVAARFGAEVEALATDLVDRVGERGRADLRTELAGPLSVAVILSLLGLDAVDAATVLDWYAAIVDAVSSISAGVAAGPAAATAVAELAAHVRAGLRGRADSILVAAGGCLDEADVVANAAVMMFGGIETTEGMIANVMLHLLENPAALAEVRADPSLAGGAVEESLRLQPAAAVVDRYATRTVTLGGADIGAGDLVRVSLTGANRDPDVFADPEVFDLHRANTRAQLSFARGPHVCIAMDLARLEARVAVRVVLDRLPHLRLAGPAAARGLIFRKPPTLGVTWTPA